MFEADTYHRDEKLEVLNESIKYRFYSPKRRDFLNIEWNSSTLPVAKAGIALIALLTCHKEVRCDGNQLITYILWRYIIF